MQNELGSLRCLHALGEYEELAEGAEALKQNLKVMDDVDEYHTWMSEVQKLGANAAWMLGRWDSMEDFVEVETLSSNTVDVNLEQNRSFYQAIIAIHKQDYTKATDIINSTRGQLVDTVSSLLEENYSRANKAMISMQVSAVCIFNF